MPEILWTDPATCAKFLKTRQASDQEIEGWQSLSVASAPHSALLLHVLPQYAGIASDVHDIPRI